LSPQRGVPTIENDTIPTFERTHVRCYTKEEADAVERIPTKEGDCPDAAARLHQGCSGPKTTEFNGITDRRVAEFLQG
jgi:hypothetical protein